MSGVRQLWRRGQRGWPERYPLAQLPNAPLLLAMGAGLVAARTDGVIHTGARTTFHAAFSFWGWSELTAGANVVRRALGAGALGYTAADIGRITMDR